MPIYIFTNLKLFFHAAPVTKSGLTPLGLAVSQGKLDVIKWLIDEHKVDVNGERLYDTYQLLFIIECVEVIVETVLVFLSLN